MHQAMVREAAELDAPVAEPQGQEHAPARPRSPGPIATGSPPRRPGPSRCDHVAVARSSTCSTPGVRRDRDPGAGEHHAGGDEHVGEVVLPADPAGGGVEHGHHPEVVDDGHSPSSTAGSIASSNDAGTGVCHCTAPVAQVARLDPRVPVAVADGEHDATAVHRRRGGVAVGGRLPPERAGGEVEHPHRGRRPTGASVATTAPRCRVDRAPDHSAPGCCTDQRVVPVGGVERGERARVVAHEHGVAGDRERVGRGARIGRVQRGGRRRARAR